MLPFRCATCVFFSQHRPSWSDRPQPRGQCRRHAPVLDKDPDGRLRTLWPTVHEDNYCGEHAEIEAAVEQPERRIDYETLDDAVVVSEQPVVLPLGPQWRCVNCKEVTVSIKEPEKCAVCLCRQFAKVDVA